MTTTIDPAIDWLRTHVTPTDAILCATSGGLDSMCLAHLLHQLGYPITVAHYHHGLRDEADSDATFVEQWCRAHAVPFVLERGDVRGYAAVHGLGIEEAGRTLRYNFLNRTATAYGCQWIATAHHGDDNVETMLLNLCRGTGLAGLCGIPAISGKVIRPFLGVSRADLEGYSVAEHISHITDHTNADITFARNRLRHQVLPILETINPQFVAHFNQTATILTQEQEFLTTQASAIARLETDQTITFRWADLDPSLPLAHRAVHQAICRLAGKSRDITAQHITSALSLPRTGTQVSLPYGLVATATSSTLVVEPSAPLPTSAPLIVEKPMDFGAWQVVISRQNHPLSQAIYLPEGSYTVTTWQSQDRLGQRTVKRLFLDRGIGFQERDTLPVVRLNGQVVAVCKVGVHPDFVTTREGTSPFYIRFINKGEHNHG
ncbi:tRNA lysidine(34) synthetase TilS [Bengtsoniella intestinalis]|uniref:tRNA lysidine(34) synthetase TilS n=1 Tax=Bengtsoniella intestinalis TaxID=3073143 RepID=UPI00391F4DEA